MAVTVNFGDVSPEIGVYGLYNDFFMIISREESVYFKLSYRIKCTIIAEPTYVFERDVRPIGEDSIVNPVEFLKDSFFRTQVIGLNGKVLDDSSTVDVANFGCNRIKIEVGQSYSDSVDVPATFRGYDTSTNITFYNGYENINIPNTSTDYANYLDPKWYDSATAKLNHTILNRKLSINTDDENKVFTPNVVELNDGEYKLNALYTDSYNSSGVLVNQEIEPIDEFDDLKGYSIYNLPKRSTATTGQQRTEYYFRYVKAGATNRFTDKIKVTQFDCNQNERYRLRWFNRYGTFEYLNCNGRLHQTNNYKRGKEILTDGVDLLATSFATIKSVAKPELVQVGTTKEINYTLHTGYLTQEEADGLKELIDSPNVIMYDPSNNIIPINPTDTSFKVEDSNYGLIKYKLTLKAANRGKTIQR